MLPKRERLTRTQFDHFFAVGKRLHSPLVQVIYTESPEPHGSAVVGKKVAKRAVDRNTLRRRMYALLYPYLKNASNKKTVILVAKKGALETSRKEFAEQLGKLLQKIYDV
jgi:ribonuclease P protein component